MWATSLAAPVDHARFRPYEMTGLRKLALTGACYLSGIVKASSL